MKPKTTYLIFPLLLLGVFLVFASSCEKNDDNNNGGNNGGNNTGIPVLSTTVVTDITQTAATSGGNITSDGGATVTARGVCWSTGQTPTISDNKTTDGTGAGSFISNISGLTPNTTYYVRAYATNSNGTGYGSAMSLTTQGSSSCPPTVTFTYNGYTVTYGTVTSSGKCWLDRNLGAAQVATSSTDTAAYGDLFQWGRADDGHQIRTSATTATLSNTDTPGHANFIRAASSPYDWRSPQNPNLWQGVNGVNNPCPNGWRIPTEAEWNAERLSWSTNNAAGAFASTLKLPVAGYRNDAYGTLFNVGLYGSYWSSTVSSTYSRNMYFASTPANESSNDRADAFSVRCIKDN